ncbi:MAG: hypothetical protein V8R64_10620 [Thomasclavelia sp.]
MKPDYLNLKIMLPLVRRNLNIFHLTDNNEYHLKVTVIDKHMVYYINGELVMNTADYTMD